jgi:hypothetical protein
MLSQLDEKVANNGWSNVRTASVLPESSSDHDLVVCSSVLGFVDDYPGMVSQLVELLRPGGVFVQWDWERNDEDEDEEPYGLSRTAITAALDAAGLTSVTVDVGFSLPTPHGAMEPLMGVGRKSRHQGRVPGCDDDDRDCNRVLLAPIHCSGIGSGAASVLRWRPTGFGRDRSGRRRTHCRVVWHR